jgi:hypothetical protein
MRNATVTAILGAPRATVFGYIADIENLPR